MKICLLGVQLFLADGRMDRQTDIMKPIVAFRNFANTPKTQRTKRPRFREVEFYLQKRPTFLETEKFFFTTMSVLWRSMWSVSTSGPTSQTFCIKPVTVLTIEATPTLHPSQSIFAKIFTGHNNHFIAFSSSCKLHEEKKAICDSISSGVPDFTVATNVSIFRGLLSSTAIRAQ